MSEPARVLHADDDPELLSLSRTVLDRDDDAGPLNAATAATGAEALATLADGAVDCFVSDSMVGPDGRPLVSAVREAYPSLPVVMFTGHDQPTGADDADAVVEKGAGFEALASAVRGVLDADGAPTEGWTVVGRHDWRAGVELVTTLVPALAAHLDRPVDEMPELYGAVDGEALEHVLRPREDRTRRACRVTFRYCGLDVRLTREGVVSVRDRR